MRLSCVAVVLAASSGSASGQVVYEESFETGAGGWDVVTTLNATFAATLIASGGAPGGFIRSSDPDSGGSYWRAPADFRAALASGVGGSLMFSQRISAYSPAYDNADVIATAPGLVLYFDLPAPASTAWTTLVVGLDSCAAWRVGSATGRIATVAEMQQVFTGCTDFRIRAEFRSGAEDDDLDTVIIDATPTPTETAASTFDTSTEGWSGTGDFHPPQWIATGGNPDGYLQIRDIGDGRLWTYLAPAKFLCDQSKSIGGVLSFDIKTTATGYNYPADAPDIWIEGLDGMTLGARMAVEPGTSWTHYEFPMVEDSWRVGAMNGPVPTTEEFLSVLSRIAALRIRGEFSSTLDTGGLDNVILGEGFPCPADFNQDGGIDGADVEAFFAAWEGGDYASDVNQDGGIDGADVEYFFSVWEAGGCAS